MDECLGRVDEDFSLEGIGSLVLVAGLVGLVFWCQYVAPVWYVRLIAEDCWGEYATAVCFALAGVCLALASHRERQNRWLRRTLAVMALAALFAAGEEVSWGQRILRISTPEIIRQSNRQGELNVHNLAAVYVVKKHLHEMTGSAILAWCLLSLIALRWSPNLRRKCLAYGVPLLPLSKLPVFLLVPCFFLHRLVAKGDEIGELFLGIALLVWAVPLCLVKWSPALSAGRKGLGATVAAMATVCLAATLLSVAFPGDVKWRLNKTAQRDYPALGMVAQAERLYEYIYAHPEYLMPDTRMNHARLLLGTGQLAKAKRILAEATEGGGGAGKHELLVQLEEDGQPL